MSRKWLIVVLPLVLWACSSSAGPRTVPGQLKPDSPEYLMNEGLNFLNRGNLAAAEQKLLAALKKRPTLIRAQNGLGLVYTYRRDFPKAIASFKRVIQLDPSFTDAYNTLGILYTETGQYDAAKENLLIAANASNYQTPENAYANLALLEIRFNRPPDSALRYIEKGLSLNNAFAPLYNLKGIILENSNDLRGAVENFEKALSLIKEPDAFYLFNLGRVFSKLGEKQSALDKLEQAMTKTQDPNLKKQIQDLIRVVEKP